MYQNVSQWTTSDQVRPSGYLVSSIKLADFIVFMFICPVKHPRLGLWLRDCLQATGCFLLQKLKKMLKELHLFAKNCFELCTLYGISEGISEVLGEKGEKSRPSQVCGSCIIWRKASSHLFHSGCKAWKWTGLVIHKRMSHFGIDEDFHIAVSSSPQISFQPLPSCGITEARHGVQFAEMTLDRFLQRRGIEELKVHLSQWREMMETAWLKQWLKHTIKMGIWWEYDGNMI